MRMLRTGSTCVTGVLATLAIVLLTPSTALAQRRVPVNIDSAPQGATVRLDSETSNPVGTTPLRRFRIPAGAHTLFVTREGYITGRVDVSVGRRNETFTATLTQAGSIYVSSDVDGAQVFLDGNAVGTTPGRVNNVQPGQHILEVRQAGMQPHRETVTVGAGAVASVNASLRPPPPVAPPTGVVRVIVSNPNGAVPGDLAVTFDGSPVAGTPPSIDAAQPGQHILQVSAAGFRTVRREVAVTAGQTVAIAIDLEQVVQVATGGVVRVIVQTPGAVVFLDGEAMEGTPPQRANVPGGTHALRITAPGRAQVTREITVTVGQTTAVEIPDLVVAGGRLVVRSNTPNAAVFIDGRSVGSSPYERTDMPPGDHEVRVTAQGFDDRTQTCTVSATQACDLSVNLTRTVGRAALHVELSRPARSPAHLVIDGEDVGEVGAGRDVPNLTAAAHEIRVRAEGYADYVESVNLQEGENHRTLVTLRRNRRGPSGTEVAARRTAISTLGASPLSRGDAAIDIALAYGAYPAEVRGMIGLLPGGIAGFDVGFGLRTMLFYNELELRGRFGVRLAEGLVSLGAEANVWGALSVVGGGGGGFRGFLLASFHTLALSSDDANDDDADSGARERSNPVGSFAFTLRFGFEALFDGLNNQLYAGGGDRRPRFEACNDRAQPEATPAMPNPPLVLPPVAAPCNIALRATAANGDRVVQSGGESLIRTIAGFRLEFGLGRHWNLFGGLDIAPFALGSSLPTMASTTPATPTRRAIYQMLWFGSDPAVAISIGVTYKF